MACPARARPDARKRHAQSAQHPRGHPPGRDRPAGGRGAGVFPGAVEVSVSRRARGENRERRGCSLCLCFLWGLCAKLNMNISADTMARDAETLSNLGVTLAQQGKLDQAIPTLREAVRLKPDYAKAQHNLGVALAHQGRPDEAVGCFRQALQCKQDYAEACYNLGNVLAELKQHDEAVAAYRRAIAIKPDYFDAYNNLGLLLVEPSCSEKVSAVEKGDRTFANIGNPNKEQGRLEEAVASYSIALAYQPDSVSAHWNRALARLQQGNFKEGWAEYEWRWQRKQTPMRSFRQPRWDGGPLAGRTILLWMEQGLGDMIQFIRYAAPLQEQGARRLVECPGFLIPPFATSPALYRLTAHAPPLP